MTMPTTSETRPPNPRGDKRGGSRPAVEQSTTVGPLWIVLAILCVLLIGQGLFTASRDRAVSCSEFKEMVRGGRAAEIVMTSQEIRGTTVGDTDAQDRFTVVRIDDPALVEELEAQGVQISGELESEWFPGLLIWTLPFLILLGISYSVFRQRGRAQSGVMAFSRTRARIYAEDDVKVTFADVAGVDEAKELGGRAAEEVALGEISTGAQNDLVRATDLARSMVAELGMGETSGVMSTENRQRGRFLEREGRRRPEVAGGIAERTAEQIVGHDSYRM